MSRFLVPALFLLTMASAPAEEISLGASLPEVTVPNSEGETVDLAEAGAEGYTLVYFYPKADTPGCTAQACSLRDAFAYLSDAGVRVFGVSGDSVADQAAFKEKYSLPFTLLADTESKVMDAFGVPRRGSFASRQAFLFKDGELVWRDLRASTQKQADDVRSFLES
ncbi:MAG: peroxiredoxin [Opitutales bacterium]